MSIQTPPSHTDVDSQTRVAVRNVGWLVAQRVCQTAAAVAFASLIPRTMGPAVFGRYALLASISLWFSVMSGLGAAPLLTRFVPQFLVRGDHAGLKKLVTNLVVLRMGNSVLAGAIYFLLTALWLRDLDRVSLALVAATVCVRTGGSLFFTVFLGLNQAARWGMGDSIYRITNVALVFLGYLWGGLRGAFLGLLLAEVVVWVLGFWWARPYLSRSALRPDRQFLAPFLRFSIGFFFSNLLLTLVNRSGEAMVRLVSGDYVEVAYFGLAFSAYLTAGQAIWRLALSLAPLLTLLAEKGEKRRLKNWIEQSLKWYGIAAVVACFTILLVGDELIRLMLGSRYGPVTMRLIPLTVALLFLGPAHISRLVAVACNQPGIAWKSASIQLALFWGVGPLLILYTGSLGACLAVLLACAVYSAYATWRMRTALAYSIRRWALVVALGAAFLPLVALRSSSVINLLLYACFGVGYLLLLSRFHLVSWQEIRGFRAAFRSPASVAEA